MLRIFYLSLALVLATSSLLSLGCDDEDPPPEEGEDPGEHACEQLEATPESVTAGEVRDETAPEVHVEGRPLEVTLPAGAAGFLRVEIEEDTEALAFFADANVLTGFFHGDDPEEVTSSGANEFCAGEIADHFHLHFHEAGTYYLQLGPTASDGAWLLLVSAEGHGHDH